MWQPEISRANDPTALFDHTHTHIKPFFFNILKTNRGGVGQFIHQSVSQVGESEAERHRRGHNAPTFVRLNGDKDEPIYPEHHDDGIFFSFRTLEHLF